SASSCALAAKTSAVASLNSRPCSTSGRISSTHSLGIHSTRLLPLAMNVSDHMGCPSPPLAHQQVGVPQRRCVRASEPGKASGGICRPRSKAYLRWRKREATSPLASYHFTACIITCSHTTVKRFFSLGEFAQRTPQRSSIPTWHYSLEPELLQRRVARRKKGSKRRRKAVVLLRKIHQHIFNQRNDHHHKLARMLVQQFAKIFVEDLNIQGLSRGMLSQAVQDASWASFLAKLAYQAEEAGRQLVKVDPRGTSQRCPCGARVPKKLSDREHVCTACGLIGKRDHVSAMEILRLGLSLQDVTKPEVRVCVS